MRQCADGSMYKRGVFGGGGGVKICERSTNKMWGWGEWMLCSLWPRLSWILRFALMRNLILFTDICLHLSFIIILAKLDTTLDHVMTRPLVPTACTAVALWICIHWVPADIADIPKFSLFLLLLRINSSLLPRLDEESFNDFFFSNYSFSVKRPTLCIWRS